MVEVFHGIVKTDNDIILFTPKFNDLKIALAYVEGLPDYLQLDSFEELNYAMNVCLGKYSESEFKKLIERRQK